MCFFYFDNHLFPINSSFFVVNWAKIRLLELFIVKIGKCCKLKIIGTAQISEGGHKVSQLGTYAQGSFFLCDLTFFDKILYFIKTKLHEENKQWGKDRKRFV